MEPHGGSKSVICLTDGLVYESTKSASLYYNTSSVGKCCRKERKFCKNNKTGEMLSFMFFDEYNKISDKHSLHNRKYKNKHSKMVMCVNTGQIFDSIKDAGAFYGANTSAISQCCLGKAGGSGRHPETKELLVWRYVEIWNSGIFDDTKITESSEGDVACGED
jgi:hypothetical protein